MNFHIPESICKNIPEASSREWLDTNACGAYASSTILNCNTRKYHGLLVSTPPAPASGKHVLLSRYEETISTRNETFLLNRNEYVDAPFDAFANNLVGFTQADYPSWIYRIGKLLLQQEFMMLSNTSGCIMKYSLLKWDEPVTITLKPLLAFRRTHSTVRKNSVCNHNVEMLVDGFSSTPYHGMPTLYFKGEGSDSVHLEKGGYWYRNVLFNEEKRRGYPHLEDLFMPAGIHMQLATEKPVYILASTESLTDPSVLWEEELSNRRKAAERRKRVLEKRHLRIENHFPIEEALRAAEQFVSLGTSTEVTSGFHWLEGMGRITIQSVPGLFFCTGRTKEGLQVLRSNLSRERNGLLPNYINGKNNCDYRAADIPLLLFWALQQYLEFGGDTDVIFRDFWPAMKRIINAFAAGTDHNIYMEPQGLLHAGGESTSLTWMDARINGRPLTPRCGFAVEVNALWYNALCFADKLAEQFRDRMYTAPINTKMLRKRFVEQFQLPQHGYLADVINEKGTDSSLRPNQLWAVSLPFSALSNSQCESIVRKVEKELLTIYGLRTLTQRDFGFIGHCCGTAAERDSACHQGSVFPWLLAPFGEAWLKIHNYSGKAFNTLKELTADWYSHMEDAGVGHFSELFDGEFPHEARGCIAHALNTAELIRLNHLLFNPPKGKTFLTRRISFNWW